MTDVTFGMVSDEPGIGVVVDGAVWLYFIGGTALLVRVLPSSSLTALGSPDPSASAVAIQNNAATSPNAFAPAYALTDKFLIINTATEMLLRRLLQKKSGGVAQLFPNQMSLGYWRMRLRFLSIGPKIINLSGQRSS